MAKVMAIHLTGFARSIIPVFIAADAKTVNRKVEVGTQIIITLQTPLKWKPAADYLKGKN